MNKLKQKLISFMYGRYGVDTLYWWLMGTVLVLWIARFVLSVSQLHIVAWIVGGIELIVLAIAIFRFLSKNIYKRRLENQRFTRFIGKFTGKFTLMRDRFRDRKTHIYKKCPHCKVVLRLPRKKGEHTVKCPKCSERFSMRVR